jgi:uncharacterized membrane protein YoaK (UPF0700 family)
MIDVVRNVSVEKAMRRRSHSLFIKISSGNLLERIIRFRTCCFDVYILHIVIDVEVTMHPPRHRLPLRTKLYEYFTANVREDHLLEAEMLALTFATGIGDATTYSEYRVFTANHTGNTLLIAVGITEDSSGHPPVNSIPIPLQLIAVSLSTFILGAWVTGQLGNRVGSQRRWWLMANNFFQSMLFFAASMIQAQHLGWGSGPRVGSLEINALSMGVVTLLAFSAGGQVTLARLLQMTEITTANATSVYADMLIDQNLFQRYNTPRNRRLCFLVTFCAGSFCGGFAYQKFGSSETLFMSSLGKGFVTLMLLFNKAGYFDSGSIDRKEDGSKSDPNS